MRRLLTQFTAVPWLALGFFEALLVVVAWDAVFYWLTLRNNIALPDMMATNRIGMAVSVVAIMYSFGLYDRAAIVHLNRTFWRVAYVALPVFALAVLVTGQLAAHTSVPIYPHTWQWTVGLTAVWLSSAVILRLFVHGVHKAGYLSRRVVFLGPAPMGRELSELAAQVSEKFRVVEQLRPLPEGEVFASPDGLASLALKARASEVVVAFEGDQPLFWNALSHCRLAGLRVTQYADFFEREGKMLSIGDIKQDWFVLSGRLHPGKAEDRVRRALDIMAASAILILTAPLLLLTAAAIKLSDGGPILYSQERIGLLGRSFMLLKFRSMHVNAESDGVPAWARERDSRITAIGRLIRKIRLDEMPQFINVLRGEMAIIGPRPERPFFVQQFSQSIPFYDFRHAVRPGITGWAQVSFRYGASLEDTTRKLSYDLYYVRNRGIALDLLIILKTIGVVMRGEGAR